MLKIIDTARRMKENNKDFISFRNYTIILLLSYSGMTSKELRNLKDDDIDFENQLITVKGKERRAFYLNSVMNSMLYSYIQLKNKKSKSEFAFPSRENKQLSKESLQRLVRNIVLEGEISSKNRELSPNTIRHSVIKMMVENKWDLPIISNICGLKPKSLYKYMDLFTPNAELKEVAYLDSHPFVK